MKPLLLPGSSITLCRCVSGSRFAADSDGLAQCIVALRKKKIVATSSRPSDSVAVFELRKSFMNIRPFMDIRARPPRPPPPPTHPPGRRCFCFCFSKTHPHGRRSFCVCLSKTLSPGRMCFCFCLSNPSSWPQVLLFLFL